jgi:hypothetical protein
LAEGSAGPTRNIAGQNTLISRTIHDMAYDPVRDEIVVPSFYAQAILTFRGDANGDATPVRKIFGPHTQLKNPEALGIDPVHGEIFVPFEGRVLVFARDAEGDTAPIRILGGPDSELFKGQAGRIHIDPVNDVLIVRRDKGGVAIFDRTASGNAKPRRVITGVGTMMTLYPPRGWIISTVSDSVRHVPGDYVGVWSINDSGNAPPRWVIGKGIFQDIRGVTIDPEHKLVMTTDKDLNAIVTFHVPEIFE